MITCLYCAGLLGLLHTRLSFTKVPVNKVQPENATQPAMHSVAHNMVFPGRHAGEGISSTLRYICLRLTGLIRMTSASTIFDSYYLQVLSDRHMEHMDPDLLTKHVTRRIEEHYTLSLKVTGISVLCVRILGPCPGSQIPLVKFVSLNLSFWRNLWKIPLSNCWICQAGQLFGDCGKTSHVLRGRERNKLNKH